MTLLNMIIMIIVIILREKKVVVRSSALLTPTQTRVITNILNINTSDTLVLNNQTTITQTTILLQMILNMPLEHTRYHIECPHHRESLLAVLAHTCFS